MLGEKRAMPSVQRFLFFCWASRDHRQVNSMAMSPSKNRKTLVSKFKFGRVGFISTLHTTATDNETEAPTTSETHTRVASTDQRCTETERAVPRTAGRS